MPLLIGEGGGLECTQTHTHIQTGADIITAGMGNPTLSTSNWKADSAAPCAKCLLLFRLCQFSRLAFFAILPSTIEFGLVAKIKKKQKSGEIAL